MCLKGLEEEDHDAITELVVLEIRTKKGKRVLLRVTLTVLSFFPYLVCEPKEKAVEGRRNFY